MIAADVLSAITRLDNNEHIDIIYMDAPYKLGIEESVLKALNEVKSVDSDTMIIIEAALKTDFEYLYEIGYNIAKKHWNNGYTTEAVKEVLKYLATEEKIHKFRCAHAVLNPASGAVMRKAGFKYVKDEEFEKFDKSQKFDCKVYYLDL